MNFATDGIEPARQFLFLKLRLILMFWEVRSDLLTACKLLGETFPEFDAWTEDAKKTRIRVQKEMVPEEPHFSETR